ncbi:TPA: xanthine dehydrogenase family protein molybdopterin-binding subunit [Candidatus Poribacteria bacterium]|nr:xanthine dehydrogenase family protein molybdopterin-binding subunit [Candidatus Poribacteria bacterium]
MEKQYAVIGKRTPQVDGIEKVTGRAKFTVDLMLPNMLHGKIKRSTYPHAKIKSIDTSKAEALYGVRAVVTGMDFPERKLPGCLCDGYPVARDRVLYVGEPVAAVAADTLEIAEEAVELIEVEYEELPAVFDPEEAIKPDPLVVLHEELDSYERMMPIGKMDVKRPNVFNLYKIRCGDVEKGFQESDLVVEGRYSTAYIQNAPLEPHASVAQVEADGRITVWTSSQYPYGIRKQICGYFDFPSHKVRVIIPHVGGAFGGKSDLRAEHFCIVLSQKTGRAVKIVFTRAEEFTAASVRGPYIIDIKEGVTRDGKILAREVNAIFHGGAYSEIGFFKPSFGSNVIVGSYKIPNLKSDVYGVYTNHLVSGAYRAFGCPELAWGIESHMDIVAEKLGMDAVEFRLKNVIEEGDKNAAGEIMHSVGAKECLLKVAEAISWSRESEFRKAEDEKLPPLQKGAGGLADESSPWKRGKGIALGSKYSFAPTGSSVIVKVHHDGIELRTSAVDLGQGSNTVLAQIVGEEFGIPADEVLLILTDTDITPPDHQAGSSRQTYIVGNSTRLACLDAKRQLFEKASEKIGVAPDRLATKNYKIFVKDSPDKSINISDLFDDLFFVGPYQREGAEILGKATFNQDVSDYDPDTGQGERRVSFYSHGAQAAEVEVNVETGKVKIVKFVSAMDVGKAINPMGVEGQMEGGVHMGISNALYEHLVIDNGQVVNPNFMDYKIPNILELPHVKEIQSLIVEAHHRDGPYGAKGAGEVVLVPTAPAIANAIYNAVGVRIKDMPITAEKILNALKEK